MSSKLIKVDDDRLTENEASNLATPTILRRGDMAIQNGRKPKNLELYNRGIKNFREEMEIQAWEQKVKNVHPTNN